MSNKSNSQLPEPESSVMLLKADTWKKLSQLMQLLQVSFDPRVFVTKQKADGKQITLRSVDEFLEAVKAEVSVSCPLGDLQRDAKNSTKSSTKYKITPGYVHGGGKSIFLEKDNISPQIGHSLYIEIEHTQRAADGVLEYRGDMNSATIKVGSEVPEDDDINIESLTGKHRYPLGKWLDDGNGNPSWNKGGCGSYVYGFCRQFTGKRDFLNI